MKILLTIKHKYINSPTLNTVHKNLDPRVDIHFTQWWLHINFQGFEYTPTINTLINDQWQFKVYNGIISVKRSAAFWSCLPLVLNCSTCPRTAILCCTFSIPTVSLLWKYDGTINTRLFTGAKMLYVRFCKESATLHVEEQITIQNCDNCHFFIDVLYWQYPKWSSSEMNTGSIIAFCR